jgi:pyruvate formate lyase activating enzyme
MTGSPTEQADSALVFDIQRLSLDDGPGIRTSIFFQGCPLSCLWCHNPESRAAEPRLAFTKALCRTCAACVVVCPQGAHRFEVRGDVIHHLVDHEACERCGACVDVCCHDALALPGRLYTVDELVREIETDRPYYHIGEGGGITLTGGEPMQHPGFIASLLERLEGIHVCVETCGHAPSESFLMVASRVDLFLFDYKATEPGRHRRLCGVDNALILANLDLLCALGRRVALRLPLIPGVNDDEAHLRGIAALVERLPAIEYVQVMPYHDLGAGKQERFGLTSPMLRRPSASAEQKASWHAQLVALGVPDVRM